MNSSGVEHLLIMRYPREQAKLKEKKKQDKKQLQSQQPTRHSQENRNVSRKAYTTKKRLPRHPRNMNQHSMLGNIRQENSRDVRVVPSYAETVLLL